MKNEKNETDDKKMSNRFFRPISFVMEGENN